MLKYFRHFTINTLLKKSRKYECLLYTRIKCCLYTAHIIKIYNNPLYIHLFDINIKNNNLQFHYYNYQIVTLYSSCATNRSNSCTELCDNHNMSKTLKKQNTNVNKKKKKHSKNKTKDKQYYYNENSNFINKKNKISKHLEKKFKKQKSLSNINTRNYDNISSDDLKILKKQRKMLKKELKSLMKSDNFDCNDDINNGNNDTVCSENDKCIEGNNHKNECTLNFAKIKNCFSIESIENAVECLVNEKIVLPSHLDKKNQNDFKLEEDCTMLDASVINKSEEKSNSNEVTDEENTSINAINKNISELNLENAFVNKSNISDNSGCELHSNSSDLMKQHDNHNNLKSRSAKKHLKKEKLEDEKFEEIRQYEYTLQGCGFIKEPYDAKEKQVRFTIISYNVLSQALLEDNMRLYRDHDPMYLNWAYRSTLLMKELTKIGADIMCLQEVEDRHKLMFFDQFLQKGYQGIYKKRTGDKGDGCAIYYKTEKFVLVDYATVEYYQPNIDVLNRDNIAIVAKFHPVGFPNNPIVVATTHLLYNPRRHDIKLAQTQILLAEIERFAFKNPNSKFKYHPVILTGDFNLEPYSSVYELILLGKLNYEKLDRKMLKSTVDQGVCSYPPYGLPMGKYLLPPSLGVTDNCMHYGLNELRLNSATVKSSVQDYLIGLYNSDRHNVPKDFPQCEKMSDLFSTGTLYNRNFDFYTVHFHEDNKSMSEATTKHHEWITVDYMFFTPLTDPTYRHNQLQLISRKRLPTVFECEHYLRNIPNRLCPSDHLPIVATFFLRIPSKCV